MQPVRFLVIEEDYKIQVKAAKSINNIRSK